MATAYPELVQRLRRLLIEYRAKRLPFSDLQSVIWETAEAVVSYEDRELRKCLQWAEGKLDVLQFTKESPDLFAASLEVVTILEEKIHEALRQ